MLNVKLITKHPLSFDLECFCLINYTKLIITYKNGANPKTNIIPLVIFIFSQLTDAHASLSIKKCKSHLKQLFS